MRRPSRKGRDSAAATVAVRGPAVAVKFEHILAVEECERERNRRAAIRRPARCVAKVAELAVRGSGALPSIPAMMAGPRDRK